MGPEGRGQRLLHKFDSTTLRAEEMMMARKTRRTRRLNRRFENLERRQLLAGNVQAGFDQASGLLTILGDPASNGLAIAQLADVSQPGVPPVTQLWLKPDATTRLNGQQPGVGVIVSGVTSISAQLGDGADDFALLGREGSSLTALSLDLGRGNDDVTMKGVKILQNVALSGSDGGDVVRISDSSVDGELDVQVTGGLDMTLERSQVGSLVHQDTAPSVAGAPLEHLKIKLSDVLVSSFMSVNTENDLDVSVDGGLLGELSIHKELGASSTGVAASPIYLKLRDVLITGAVDVDVEGASLVDVSSSGSEMNGVYLKIGGVDGQSAPLARVALDSSVVAGPLSLTTEGAVDFSSSRSSHKEWILIESVSAADQPIEEVAFVYHTIKFVDTLVSSYVAVDAQGGGLDFAAQGSSLASIYMKYDGVSGDVSLPPATARVSLSDGSIDGPLSLSTDATIDVSSSRMDHKEWILIESVSFATPGAASPPALHRVKFVDTLVSSYVDVDVQGDGLLDVSAQTSQASGMYLKMGGVEGDTGAAQRTTRLSLDGGTVDDLSVETDGVLQASATGQHIKKAVLFVRKQGTDQQDYYQVTLSDLLVSSFSTTSDGSSSHQTSVQGGSAKLVAIEGRSSSDPLFDPIDHYKIDIASCVVDGAVTVDVDGDLDLLVDESSIAAFSVSGHGGDSHSRPMESLSLNFAKVELRNHQQDERSLSITGGSMDSLLVDVSSASPDGTQSPYIFKMTDVLVTGVASVDVDGDLDLLVDGSSLAAFSVSGDSDDRPMESISLSYTKVDMHYRPLGESSLSLTGGSMGSVSVDVNDPTSLGANPSLRMTMEGVSVAAEARVYTGGRFSLDITGSNAGFLFASSGGGTGKASFSDLSFSSVHFSDDGTTANVSVVGGQTDSVWIDLGHPPSPAGSDEVYYTITLTDCLVSSVQLNTDGATDFITEGSRIGSLAVDIDDGGGGSGGSLAMESLSMNFSKMDVRYNPQTNNRTITIGGGRTETISLDVDAAPNSAGTPAFLQLEMENVLVSSYMALDAVGLGGLSIEFDSVQGSLFDASYASGAGGGAGKAQFQDFHFSGVSLRDQGATTSVEISGGQADSIALQRSAGDGTTEHFFTVVFKEGRVANWLEIQAGNAHVDVDVSRSQIGNVRVATGDFEGDGRFDQSIRLTDSLISGLADFSADGIADIVIANSRVGSASVRAADSFEPLPGVPGPISRVTIAGSRVLGRLTVDTGSGDDVVTISKSILSGSTSIDVGGGNDRLAVLDSIFSRFALFDGGDGIDQLTIARSRAAQKPITRNWESFNPSPSS